MGTRADFYVGRGESAEWIGSVAYDGYPDGISEDIHKAETEEAFRRAVGAYFGDDRDDVTLPKDGWPWPWEDSRTTDYAYAFEAGHVYTSCFGGKWRDYRCDPIKDGETDDDVGVKVAIFPKLGGAGASASPGSKRSGIMLFGVLK